MHLEIKQELFDELPIEGKFNFQYEFERAYNQVVGHNPIITKDVAKEAIKAILIDKLNANANAEHKTLFGRIFAVVSKVGAVLLKFIKI
jgi:hypothetical protein